MLPPTWTAMADRSLNRPPPWHPGTPGLSILPKNSRTPVVVPHSNSTSNHNRFASVKQALDVVSHSNSTSNHNSKFQFIEDFLVVSHSNSTSNHNYTMNPCTEALVVSHSNSTSKITMPGNQLYTKLCNKYVANFTSLMRRENQQIQLMLILCYPVI